MKEALLGFARQITPGRVESRTRLATPSSEGLVARPTRRHLLLVIALTAAVTAVLLGPVAHPASAALVCQNDEQGANDLPGQKDLTRQCQDNAPAAGTVGVSWNWDTIGFSGSNTGDACTLFDTDADGKVNFAVCVTIEDTPAVQAATSPRIYTCGDDKVDRCTSPVTQVASITTSCNVAQSATDPFVGGEAYPLDTTATCTVQLSDVGGTAAKLVNTCSYPSQQPNSDPSDCVLIPRDGFLVIVKNASPNDASAQFAFTLDSTPPAVFTTNGSGTSPIIPVRTVDANNDAVTHSLTESFPTGWTLDTVTCSDGSGTRSGSSINGISVGSDETVTCTFGNSRDTGKLEVVKDLIPSQTRASSTFRSTA